MADQNPDSWLPELLSEESFIDEKALTALIERRVEQLLVDNPDLLFSYLYRLDVDEYKIQSALRIGDGVALSLASLIVQRQKLRLNTKNTYRSNQDAPESANKNNFLDF